MFLKSAKGMIQVMYKDNTFGIVSPVTLETLIQNETIVQFLRADGWATIGVDPVRRASRASRSVTGSKNTCPQELLQQELSLAIA